MEIENETWVVWILWRCFAVFFLKAVAISVTRLWQWRTGGPKPEPEADSKSQSEAPLGRSFGLQLLTGMAIGLLGALILQVWNAAEMVVLNRCSPLGSMIFYSATVAFIYLAQEEQPSALTEEQEAQMPAEQQRALSLKKEQFKTTVGQVIVVTALLNTLLKTRTQLLASHYLLGTRASHY